MKSVLFSALLFFVIAISAQAVPPPGWTENYAKAVEQAKAENKNVLLDFTGSDWCGYCIVLGKEVFSSAHFKTWAKKNVVLVEVDFPHKKTLSAELKAQNDELKSKYPTNGFPTIVIVDPSGTVLAKKTGYHPGSGPQAYVSELEAAMKK